MDGIDLRFDTNDRVRLRASVDPSIYGEFACLGNEGWVRGLRLDRFGLPEVLVEWDQEHWAYNGVPDLWTFAEHFELVENMDKQDAAKQAALEFAEKMGSLFDDEPTDKPTQSDKLKARFLEAGRVFDTEPDEDKELTEATEAAGALLEESSAFLIIGLDQQERPYALGYATTPKGELAVQAHLAGVAAKAHQDLALRSIAAILAEG